MRTKAAAPKSIDEYIAGFPRDVQTRLKRVRETVTRAAPAAEEKISYGIPALMLQGQLVYFAAFRKHIGVYPRPKVVDKDLAQKLSRYVAGKGTFQFPLDEPLPVGLIARVVKLRVKENLARAAAKKAH
jgi:uncharacterized protein YdhG (YjbR/CyaY superfamily)